MSSAAPPPIVRSTSARPALGGAAAVAGVAIVVAAGVMRLSHIGAGIPYNVGQDEPQIINRVFRMMVTGDFNPHFFDWPSLTIYMNVAVGCVTFLTGAMGGAWNNLNAMPVDALFLAGRQFTALIGTATVAVMFSIGRRWGNGVAVLAAALMAVIPNHVRESHYVLTDIPTAFFTTLTLLLSLRALEQPTTRRLLWAAASAGLAASCKYNGSMAVVMPLVVVWITGSAGGGLSDRLSRTGAVIGVALAAFLVGTPYAILDLPAFLNDYARLASIFAGDRPGEAAWSIYSKHLLGAMWWPTLTLALAGVVIFLRRVIAGPARVMSLIPLAFAVVYFIVMARSYQVYGRYLLPLFPPLCLFAAVAGVEVVKLTRQVLRRGFVGTLAGATIIVVMLAGPAMGSWSVIRNMDRPSTVGLAYQWMLANLPAGATVVVEAGALQLPPPYRTIGETSLITRTYGDYVEAGATHFLAASAQFQATVRDPLGNREATVAYRRLLNQTTEIAAFDPSATVLGPILRLYQVPR